MVIYVLDVTHNSLTIRVDKEATAEVTYDVAVYERSTSGTNV